MMKVGYIPLRFGIERTKSDKWDSVARAWSRRRGGEGEGFGRAPIPCRHYYSILFVGGRNGFFWRQAKRSACVATSAKTKFYTEGHSLACEIQLKK